MSSFVVTDALRETLAVFDRQRPGTPLTTTEVATELDSGRRSTFEKLDRLADGGYVATKAVGARGRVWWLPVGSAALVDQLAEAAFLTLDPDGRVRYVSEPAVELLSLPAEPLLGSTVWECIPEFDAAELVPQIDEAMVDGTTTSAELRSARLGCWLQYRLAPTESGLGLSLRDVTERMVRERRLERYELIAEAVDDGIYLVDQTGHFTMVNDAYAAMTGYDRDELLGAHVSLVADEQTVETASEYDELLRAGDRETGRIEADLVRKDGGTVRAEATFAVLTDADGQVERVGVVRDVSDRLRRERTLKRQRRELAALDSLNTVARKVTNSVIEQSTRQDVERAVCEVLAGSESYSLAWVGDVDRASGTVTPHISAPTTAATESLVSDPLSTGPIRRATHTGTLQVTTSPASITPPDGWDAHTDTGAFRSAAVIPVVHEATLYGILCVYTEREAAFSAAERDVVDGLGEVVGQAIASIERKRALMSDEVVELEFRLSNLGSLLGIEMPADGRVEIGQTIPLGGDEFLVYATANDAGVEIVEAAESALDHWESVDLLEAGPDVHHLQVRLSEPPVSAKIAAFGGSIQQVVFADDMAQFVVHTDPGTGVRPVIEVIDETFNTTELIRRRQFTRSEATGPRSDDALQRLTDRQRSVLMAAHGGGYFDQPRRQSGAEIADTMDISTATFHEHLRAAMRKLTTSAFADV
ncbi:bacterio-opsin activator domain-containing protein [Haloarchaeobius baliensis]|uniref:bacterio-opsin activator domain-containing protein n=1 Tax=Haloarchaeobius baliensis TaxID=1670458 RepID=UPI003F884559